MPMSDYLLYTLIKLYYTKALSDPASSLAPDWIHLLRRPGIPHLIIQQQPFRTLRTTSHQPPFLRKVKILFSLCVPISLHLDFRLISHLSIPFSATPFQLCISYQHYWSHGKFMKSSPKINKIMKIWIIQTVLSNQGILGYTNFSMSYAQWESFKRNNFQTLNIHMNSFLNFSLWESICIWRLNYWSSFLPPILELPWPSLIKKGMPFTVWNLLMCDSPGHTDFWDARQKDHLKCSCHQSLLWSWHHELMVNLHVFLCFIYFC